MSSTKYNGWVRVIAVILTAVGLCAGVAYSYGGINNRVKTLEKHSDSDAEVLKRVIVIENDVKWIKERFNFRANAG